MRSAHPQRDVCSRCSVLLVHCKRDILSYLLQGWELCTQSGSQSASVTFGARQLQNQALDPGKLTT